MPFLHGRGEALLPLSEHCDRAPEGQALSWAFSTAAVSIRHVAWLCLIFTGVNNNNATDKGVCLGFGGGRLCQSGWAAGEMDIQPRRAGRTDRRVYYLLCLNSPRSGGLFHLIQIGREVLCLEWVFL